MARERLHFHLEPMTPARFPATLSELQPSSVAVAQLLSFFTQATIESHLDRSQPQVSKSEL